MAEEYDAIIRWSGQPKPIPTRTVLVEGNSDERIFKLAAKLEFSATGKVLLGSDLAIVAAGEADRGGASGLNRELIALRGIARISLLPNGRQQYRFIGLFDDDRAGRLAIKSVREFDRSILEYKDVFRLRPTMPTDCNLDPEALKRACEEVNSKIKGLDWELEDMLAEDFIRAFSSDSPGAIRNTTVCAGYVHHEFTKDGKVSFHKYISQYAIHADLKRVIDALRAIRYYLGLKS